jgi:hypothetical protein
MRNVLIPVTVQPMQIVKPAITEAFALADRATQEILMLKAVDQFLNQLLKNKTVELMLIVLLLKSVTKREAETVV